MTDERNYTRRDSLKRIAASGVLLGATGLSAQAVSAGDETTDGPKDGLEINAVSYVDERVYYGKNEIELEPNEPGRKATASFTIPVGDDDDGNALERIVANFYRSGIEFPDDHDDLEVTVDDEDVSGHLSGLKAEKDNQILLLLFDGEYTLEAGDSIRVTLPKVRNPPRAGLYNATFMLNDTYAEKTYSSVYVVGDVDDGKKKR